MKTIGTRATETDSGCDAYVTGEVKNLNWVVEIVSAYVSNNHVAVNDLPQLILSVGGDIGNLSVVPRRGSEPRIPTAAEIAASLRQDRLISFVDGRPYKTLKRHLTAHGLSPERYRSRYGLPRDYPMVAPNYSAARARIAKANSLGRKAA